ncbi:MAG: hypothetical protein PHI12_12565, partial [Dehalococcoidales bacterium]|nr:hypothetical protein [Dehalococcoidales bacterium]
MGIPNLGPAPKARDPEAVKRWLHKLSRQVGVGAAPTFRGLTVTGTVSLNLPDGLVYVKDKIVKSGPFDADLGCYRI